MFKEFSRVDSELRSTAILAKILFPPWLWIFRLRNFLQGRGKDVVPAGVIAEQRKVASSVGSHDIRVRIYRPENLPDDAPIVLYLHGGGYAMGNPEGYLFIMHAMMKKRAAIFVAPAYRLSVDAPYPAAIDDCYDTLLWVKENAAALGGRSDKIIVAGHSAGGGLTAAVSLRARDRGEVNIAYQMPIYPMIDDRMNLPSATNNTAPVWNSKANKLGWDLYLSDLHAQSAEVPYDAAPARAHDYSNLPPTATFIGTLDPFLDETRAYVENLREAGVAVEYQEFEGGFHGFELIRPKAKVSLAATSFFLDAFAKGVDTFVSAQK